LQKYQNGVALEGGNECNWFFLKLGEGDYAIQYTGPQPEVHLPPFMSGSAPATKLSKNTEQQLMSIVNSLYKAKKALEEAIRFNTKPDSTSLHSEPENVSMNSKKTNSGTWKIVSPVIPHFM
jgi:hypothetical protein